MESLAAIDTTLSDCNVTGDVSTEEMVYTFIVTTFKIFVISFQTL